MVGSQFSQPAARTTVQNVHVAANRHPEVAELDKLAAWRGMRLVPPHAA
jgi:hypothetical protein